MLRKESNGPRRLALNPPTAALIVETKNERLNALVRFKFPALSASMAVHEEAYMASESPERTAAKKRSGILVPTRPKRARANAATTPPLTTNFFLPYRRASAPNGSDEVALVMPKTVRTRPEVAKLKPWRTKNTWR